MSTGARDINVTTGRAFGDTDGICQNVDPLYRRININFDGPALAALIGHLVLDPLTSQDRHGLSRPANSTGC